MEETLTIEVKQSLDSKILLKYLEKSIFAILLIFFFGLSAFSKGFAYLHIQIRSMPLYSGEIALSIAMLWAMLFRSERLCSPVIKPLLTVGVVFLFYGFLRTSVSFIQYGSEIGTVQILRDSALCYQSLWVVFGLSLSRKDWKRFFTAILSGVGFSHVVDWFSFFLNADFNNTDFKSLNYASAGEATSPLFWVALVIWPQKLASLLFVSYGRVIFALLFAYFKKSWFFSAFVIMPGAIYLYLIKNKARFGFFRFVRSSLVPMFVGVVLVYVTMFCIVAKIDSSERYSFMETVRIVISDFRYEIYESMESFDSDVRFHHGEYSVDSKTGNVSYMAWRTHLWKNAWNGYLSAPIFGHGFGPRVVTSVLWGSTITNQGNWISGPHNSYLTIAFRMGTVGVLLFICMILIALKDWIKFREKNRLADVFLVCFLSAPFFSIFNVALENPQGGIWFWIFLGVIGGVGINVQNDILT